MSSKYKQPTVTTINGRCRVCYTCVRECPAKAIRIAHGQAEVIPERCIGCGNCVRVCSQRAKKVVSSINEVQELIKSDFKVAACIAPSFAAEFPEIPAQTLVAMIRHLGFDYVVEVGFGADLVALEIKKLLAESNGKRYISTACPAVFGYVKRYHPALIEHLAPVVSPMVAMSRVVRALYGKELKIVFIGPCIAKKIEAYSDEVEDEIDEVMTFEELRWMLQEADIHSECILPTAFDQPHAYRGALFPIGRGLLEAATIPEDLISGEVISANGRANFIDAIMEFSSGQADAKFLDVLCCDGCIMGAGMTTKASYFKRRALVSHYVQENLKNFNVQTWHKYVERLSELDLSRKFTPYDQRIKPPDEEAIRRILAKIGKYRPEDELNCGACGYDSCREHAIAIHKGLAESEMCLPFTIEELHRANKDLAYSNDQLATTREALIQSEKMASMGQLAAGIAHEINNPLGVVLMYSHLMLDELAPDSEKREDLHMIAEHADRAKKIVSGLLNFARQNKVNLKEIEIPKLIQDSIKPIVFPENIKVQINHRLKNPIAELDRDQMIQVFTNFVNNSITAMKDGGILTLETEDDDNFVRFYIKDTGSGIRKENLAKIFEPFFTTKKLGKGTGLGLAITYGILKMHHGDISVESNADPTAGPTGTTFKMTLPRRGIRA